MRARSIVAVGVGSAAALGLAWWAVSRAKAAPPPPPAPTASLCLSPTHPILTGQCLTTASYDAGTAIYGVVTVANGVPLSYQVLTNRAPTGNLEAWTGAGSILLGLLPGVFNTASGTTSYAVEVTFSDGTTVTTAPVVVATLSTATTCDCVAPAVCPTPNPSNPSLPSCPDGLILDIDGCCT